MIFVTVGTQKFQLNRLISLIDGYVSDGLISDHVIAQIGNSDYIPKNIEYSRFFDKEQFTETLSQADIVITHSGVGIIISALKQQKPVIVFPRLLKYNEHVDDHQTEIAKAFEKKGYALCCGETDDMLEFIKRSHNHPFARYSPQESKVYSIVSSFLNNL